MKSEKCINFKVIVDGDTVKSIVTTINEVPGYIVYSAMGLAADPETGQNIDIAMEYIKSHILKVHDRTFEDCLWLGKAETE